MERTKWKIDPIHSEIAFKITHLMIAKITGRFITYDADIYTTGIDFLTADIHVWIDPRSLTTGDETRDSHLIRQDFFDTENHKQITFESKEITRSDKLNHFNLLGDLTIKGFSKQIKLDVEFGGLIKDISGTEKAGFTITGVINRKDWGLTWNTTLENGGFLIDNELTIACSVELIKLKKEEKKMELEAASEEEITAE